jgi:aspartyl protease family protein
MRGAAKTIVLLGLIGALIALVARHGGDVAGLDDGRLVSLVYQIGFLVLVGAGLLRIFHNRLGEAIQAALLWVVVAMVLVAAYAYRFELRDARDRIMAELVPGRAVARGQIVEIARAGNGDFRVATEVNGVGVPMLLDTGASSVMLTRDAAIAVGLPIEMIRYTITVETANGRTQAAAVTLDRVAVGGIVEHAVPALIAQPGQLKTSLLGMSFLTRLQGWEVHGDRVVLRGAP